MVDDLLLPPVPDEHVLGVVGDADHLMGHELTDRDDSVPAFRQRPIDTTDGSDSRPGPR